MRQEQQSQPVRFGVFEVNFSAHELRKHGIRVRLPGQPFHLLSILLEKPGEVVSREEMRQRLWPSDTFVDFEHGLNSAIKKLRAALGDTPENSRYIETLPRVGYRFIAPIQVIPESPDLQRLKHNPEIERPMVTSAVGSEADSNTPGFPGAFRKSIWKFLLMMIGVVLAGLVGGIFHYRSVQSRRLTDKDTIVLADFANSTGDLVFDDTLKTALNISLRQSPFLNVLSESEVAKNLRQMTRPASTKLAPEIASELCLRSGSKAYLAGAIGSLGSEYVLELKAVNCRNGDTLAQEQVTAASKEKVLNALGDAASKVRKELGESLATVQKFDVPLAEATTSSLEALKAYSLGLREQDAAISLDYLHRAIQLDPDFAAGYYAIGNQYETRAEVERASEYFTKAFQLRNRASEYERLRIMAEYYSSVTGELDKAAQSYKEIVDSYPRSSDAYGGLIWQYLALGQFEKAEEAGRQSLRLSPDSIIPYINLSGALVSQQRYTEARQILQQAQALKLDANLHGLSLYTCSYELAFVQGDITAMLAHQKWLLSKPQFENWGFGLGSDSEAYVGHLDKARNMTKQAVDSAVRSDDKETAATWLEHAALREMASGLSARAERSATEGLKLYPNGQAVQVEAALAFAMAGKGPRAEALMQGLEKRFPMDTQMQSIWLPTIRAQLALSQSNPAQALKELAVPSQLDFGLIQFADSVSCLYPIYVRGQAYLALKQSRAAAAEFQKILDHKGIVGNCWTGALAHVGIARANALQAKTARGADADAARVRALSAYKDFLFLWKDADYDVPAFRQAKAEYAGLQ